MKTYDFQNLTFNLNRTMYMIHSREKLSSTKLNIGTNLDGSSSDTDNKLSIIF